METWIAFIIIGTTLTSVFGGVGFAVWYDQKQKRLVNQKISDQTVIDLARGNNGKVNVAYLCECTGLSAAEAKIKLQYLQQNGVLATDWSHILEGGGAYILPGRSSFNFDNIISKLVEKNEWARNLGLGELISTKKTDGTKENQAITQSKDAQIITLAIENNGLVSASSVCVKLNISIDEAQRRLEDLRQKQIFITEVNQNGGLMYRLLD